MIKDIHGKPVTLLITDGESLNALSFMIGIQARLSILTLLFSIIMHVLTCIVRKGKEIKGLCIGNEEVNHLYVT